MGARKADSGLDGILLIDKPAGWTSHDVVARVRSLTRQRRIGHTGTLDPMATGLLVLCLGRATRLVEYLGGHDKRYSGTVELGFTTTTDDAEGEPVEQRPVPGLSSTVVESALAGFRGPILQRPPAYSALKVAGRRAYQLARSGEEVALAPRKVTVHALMGRVASPTQVAIDVVCSAGTYVRSLARDLGEALGCGGHLVALRRHSAGPFDIADAVTLEELAESAERQQVDALVRPMDEGLASLPAAILGEAGVLALVQGRVWQTTDDSHGAAEVARVYASSGAFVGMGSVSESGEIRAVKVLLRGKTEDSEDLCPV